MAAGIDADPELWIIELWLRNKKPKCFFISAIEYKRLHSLLQDTLDRNAFVVFDSEGWRVALNRHHSHLAIPVRNRSGS